MDIEKIPVVILVGGKGTRLQEVTKDLLPKPLVEINGKPFLEYLLLYLMKQGFRHFILAAGHLGEMLEDFAKSFQNEKDNVKIDVSIEPEPMGTGGAIKFMENLLPEHFFLINGDTFLNADYSALANLHFNNNSFLSLCSVEIENANRFGTIKFNEDKIVTAFSEKSSSGKGHINGGIYLINKKILNSIEFNNKKAVSLEKDVIPHLIADNKRCMTLTTNSKNFIDIGTKESYKLAHEFFKQI